MLMRYGSEPINKAIGDRVDLSFINNCLSSTNYAVLYPIIHYFNNSDLINLA